VVRVVKALRSAILALAILLAANVAEPASAQPVDLQLVLAVDTSGSVSEARFELQKHGYVAAFRSPLLLKAIGSGTRQSIGVTMVQWTGPALQIQVVPWMLIRDEASMLAFADAIARAPRQLFGGGTSISGAIDHAMTLFPATELRGARRVIDVSGDGANNRGRPATLARDEAVNAGATINGLPILALEPGLDIYYRDNVIGGPGAFMVPAESFETFAEAVLKKLIIEIAGIEPPPIPYSRQPLGGRAALQGTDPRLTPPRAVAGSGQASPRSWPR
jgi:hypothetical protein